MEEEDQLDGTFYSQLPSFNSVKIQPSGFAPIGRDVYQYKDNVYDLNRTDGRGRTMSGRTREIQTFLNEQLGTKMPVDGVYGQVTQSLHSQYNDLNNSKDENPVQVNVVSEPEIYSGIGTVEKYVIPGTKPWATNEKGATFIPGISHVSQYDTFFDDISDKYALEAEKEVGDKEYFWKPPEGDLSYQEIAGDSPQNEMQVQQERDSLYSIPSYLAPDTTNLPGIPEDTSFVWERDTFEEEDIDSTQKIREANADTFNVSAFLEDTNPLPPSPIEIEDTTAFLEDEDYVETMEMAQLAWPEDEDMLINNPELLFQEIEYTLDPSSNITTVEAPPVEEYNPIKAISLYGYESLTPVDFMNGYFEYTENHPISLFGRPSQEVLSHYINSKIEDRTTTDLSPFISNTDTPFRVEDDMVKLIGDYVELGDDKGDTSKMLVIEPVEVEFGNGDDPVPENYGSSGYQYDWSSGKGRYAITEEEKQKRLKEWVESKWYNYLQVLKNPKHAWGAYQTLRAKKGKSKSKHVKEGESMDIAEGFGNNQISIDTSESTRDIFTNGEWELVSVEKSRSDFLAVTRNEKRPDNWLINENNPDARALYRYFPNRKMKLKNGVKPIKNALGVTDFLMHHDMSTGVNLVTDETTNPNHWRPMKLEDQHKLQQGNRPDKWLAVAKPVEGNKGTYYYEYKKISELSEEEKKPGTMIKWMAQTSYKNVMQKKWLVKENGKWYLDFRYPTFENRQHANRGAFSNLRIPGPKFSAKKKVPLDSATEHGLQFGGAAVTYVYKMNGETQVRRFNGSTKEIVERMIYLAGLSDDKDVQMLAADKGSFSLKPTASTKDHVLSANKINMSSGWNTNYHSGAGEVLVDDIGFKYNFKNTVTGLDTTFFTSNPNNDFLKSMNIDFGKLKDQLVEEKEEGIETINKLRGPYWED